MNVPDSVEFRKLEQRIEKLEQQQQIVCQDLVKHLDWMTKAMQEPKPTFYRGQEVEIRPGDFWVAGIYVDTKEDTKYKHGVYVFVTRMVEWWPDENIRPKQEGNK